MAEAAHVHRWVLVSAVLDGKGAWRVWACDEPWCDATAVQAASGDRRDGSSDSSNWREP